MTIHGANNKLGLIEIDDHSFGNTYSTDLLDESFKGMRPECAEGVHGLVCMKRGEYYLMCEDDGHYWIHAVLKRADVEELLRIVKEIFSTVELQPEWKYKEKDNYKEIYGHDKFPATVKRRDISLPLVTISVPSIEVVDRGPEMSYDISWSESLIKVLEGVHQ